MVLRVKYYGGFQGRCHKFSDSEFRSFFNINDLTLCLFVCNTVTAKRFDGFKVLMKLKMNVPCTRAKLRIVKDFNISFPIDSSVYIYFI